MKTEATPIPVHCLLRPYTPPEVTDYGSLTELTAAHLHGGITDVPKGTPAPAVFC